MTHKTHLYMRLLLIWGAITVYPLATAKSEKERTGADATRLAVMNFDNRSSSKEWQWLSKGLADMIITDLSASERLRIVERERPNEIAAELQRTKAGVVDSLMADHVGPSIHQWLASLEITD